MINGRTKRFKHKDGSFSYILNYSDDLLGFSPSEIHMKEVETMLRLKYKVSLDPGVPPKWVGIDLEMDENSTLLASSTSTFQAYEVPYSRFTLESLNRLQLTSKSLDKKAITDALSAVGKLLYGATTNPWLTYLSSFLASALHYDPRGAMSVCLAAIHYYGKKPAKLLFPPIIPRFLAIYTDASHSLVTCRAHAGSWLQLQESNDPEPRGNPVTWGSERLAKLYESVYSAEAKAAELALRACLKVLPSVRALYPGLGLVFFTDNKALSTSLMGNSEPHPFASSSIDFLREV